MLNIVYKSKFHVSIISAEIVSREVKPKMDDIERRAWQLVDQYMPTHTPRQKYLAKRVLERSMRTMLYELKHLLRDRQQHYLNHK